MQELPARDHTATARLSLLLVLLASACAHGPHPTQGSGPDLRAPLVLPAVGPVPFRPAALAGKVVLVNFFATWCFPCVQEVPALRALQQKYGPKGFTVVAVGLDLEGARVIAPYAEAYALPFPVLVADDAIREGRSVYGRIQELPTSVLLDGQGRALAGWSGLVSPERVEPLIEAALAKP
ncbi:MAG: TlpA family protein disulfide reductase [Myxococcaceae bacterium]|nr:TlpA family protein disulfide reductase [Myxococcaceae bacterium]MCI0674022.1 TlpA family protein disulfide reductase [Myxococcaceae bacterium]